MKCGFFLAALALLSCAPSKKPASRHPVDSILSAPLPVSPGQSITEHPREPEQQIVMVDMEPVLPPCPDTHVERFTEELSSYIEHFMKPICKTRQYKRRFPAALSYIPTIIDLVDADALRHPVSAPLDPLLIAVLIAYESSWDHEVIGKFGERGYMQVHGDIASGGFDEDDLDNPVNQLDAGIRHLRRAVEICDGDLRGALTMYGTGKRCRPYLKAVVKWRWPAYLEAVAMFRKEKDHDQIQVGACQPIVARDEK
jgi:hypothetical protein